MADSKKPTIDDLQKTYSQETDEEKKKTIKGEIWEQARLLAGSFWKTSQDQEIFPVSNNPNLHRFARETNEFLWGSLPKTLGDCLASFQADKNIKFSTYLGAALKRLPLRLKGIYWQTQEERVQRRIRKKV